MADSLASAMQLIFNAVLQNTLTNSTGVASVTLELNNRQTFTDGTTSGKADKAWGSLGRTISGASSETLDLYDFGAVDVGAGAGKDPLGGTLAIVDVVGLVVLNRATSVGTITVGADGTTAAWNSLFAGDDEAALGPIGPGGWFGVCNPTDPAFAVADTSNHLLKIASSANVTYDIFIIGRSA